MGSPTATVFADELTGRAVGPGLMKTPIMGDWDEHPHPGQAARVHSCHPTRIWLGQTLCVSSAPGWG